MIAAFAFAAGLVFGAVLILLVMIGWAWVSWSR